MSPTLSSRRSTTVATPHHETDPDADHSANPFRRTTCRTIPSFSCSSPGISSGETSNRVGRQQWLKRPYSMHIGRFCWLAALLFTDNIGRLAAVHLFAPLPDVVEGSPAGVRNPIKLQLTVSSCPQEDCNGGFPSAAGAIFGALSDSYVWRHTLTMRPRLTGAGLVTALVAALLGCTGPTTPNVESSETASYRPSATVGPGELVGHLLCVKKALRSPYSAWAVSTTLTLRDALVRPFMDGTGIQWTVKKERPT